MILCSADPALHLANVERQRKAMKDPVDPLDAIINAAMERAAEQFNIDQEKLEMFDRLVSEIDDHECHTGDCSKCRMLVDARALQKRSKP